jgi:hypothetical protein
LIKYRADLDLICREESKEGVSGSALHFAVSSRKLDGVKILIKSGISLDLKDMRGRTAFGLACKIGNIEAALWLVSETECIVRLEDIKAAEAAGHGEIARVVKNVRGKEKGGVYSIKKKRGGLQFLKNLVKGRRRA